MSPGAIKISSTGWLCVWDRGEWIAVFKLTEEQLRIKLGLRDRPIPGARRYLARFFGFFFGVLPCGFGGVLSILRSTSSGFGFGGSCGMAGV